MRRKLSRSVLKPSVGGNIPRLGQQSLELSCSFWGQIDPAEEDAQGTTQFLFQQAKDSVKEAAIPVIKASTHQMNKAKMYKHSATNQFDELDSF
ncbi:MAG: hypothetical protein RMY64_34545 [Nostoc sp. DedQUE08]|uniref:hypothetical protein n=1 Tax=Nostoc sp. DedQUE08 TaxID=3075393 RepID=UPI002AD2F7C7|nr:hypothetical protein [Nostoc sp. DedQUE08]MDZ8070674.1 hypothetical protein [Nostoc sp. DedQUE08]